MIEPPQASPDLADRVGTELGVSGWIALDQAAIDQFAAVTGDQQFIHVDPSRARDTAFGGTIVHGFFLLSLLSRMADEALVPAGDVEMVINYGLNRVRFLQPVAVGRQVRGRFTLNVVQRKATDRILLTYDVTMELEGSDQPALVAQWLVLVMEGSGNGVTR